MATLQGHTGASRSTVAPSDRPPLGGDGRYRGEQIRQSVSARQLVGGRGGAGRRAAPAQRLDRLADPDRHAPPAAVELAAVAEE